ncbi:MAG: LytTR family transcriptional regulator [Clostridiales Family XIII bacterium]|nr:LytTR family transcriptional regulator [Clostridiales Family XIII bacterium]
MRVENRFRTAYIACSDVSYVEQANRKIVVHTAFGEYWEYCSMESMLMRLDISMHRCHHSLAVNMDAIVSVSKQSVELFDGNTLSMCHEAMWRTKKAWKNHIMNK